MITVTCILASRRAARAAGFGGLCFQLCLLVGCQQTAPTGAGEAVVVSSYAGLEASLGKTVAIKGNIVHEKWGYTLVTDWTTRLGYGTIALSERDPDERFPDEIGDRAVEVIGTVVRAPPVHRVATAPEREPSSPDVHSGYFGGYFILDARIR